MSVAQYLATVNLYADYWKSLQPSGTATTAYVEPAAKANNNTNTSAERQTGSPRKPRAKRNAKKDKKSGVLVAKNLPSS